MYSIYTGHFFFVPSVGPEGEANSAPLHNFARINAVTMRLGGASRGVSSEFHSEK